MSPPIPRETARLLIELPTWVGDSVMATPLLLAARTACPGARIIGLVAPGIDSLLAGCPWLDEILVAPGGAAGIVRRARLIRQARPESILLLPNSFRAALGARIGGAKRRVGYARDGRGFLLTHGLTSDKRERPLATIEHYARLARFAFGVREIDLTPRLWVTEQQNSEGDRLLEGVGSPFAVLNPGGNRVAKRWPPERFAAVADHLSRHHGMTCVVNGSPGEREVVQAVLDSAKSSVSDLSGRGVGLGSLKAVVARAALLITNDTGPRHVAAALGTPTVCLFGPTDHRWTTLPVTSEKLLLAEPFLPETLVADDYPRACVIERIQLGDVIAAAESLLAVTRASAASATPTCP